MILQSEHPLDLSDRFRNIRGSVTSPIGGTPPSAFLFLLGRALRPHLVRRNEIRVRSHYGLARAKGSRELRRRVISDIVKRRSFRVLEWPQAIRYALPACPCDRKIVRRCFVSPLLDRRGLSVRSCKLVFLISVPPAGSASFRVGTVRRVRSGH